VILATLIPFVAAQDRDQDAGSEACDATAAGGCGEPAAEKAPPSSGRPHYWARQKGTMERTGFSPYVMPNISKGITWSFQSEAKLDTHRATPLIDDEKNIYVMAISGRAYKLRGSDGQILWSYFKPEFGTVPGVPVLDGDRMIFITTLAWVVSLDIHTGKVVWSKQVAEAKGTSTDCVLVTGGLVITSIMDPMPALLATQKLIRAELDDSAVIALNVQDGSLKWKFYPTWHVYNFQPSTIDDGSFVFQDQTGGVYRVDLNGKLIWAAARNDPKSATTAAAVISEGKVYAVSNVGGGMKVTMPEGKGLLHVYDYDTGTPLWSQQLWYEGNQAVAAGKIAGHSGTSLVLGMGQNPGVPWFMLMSFFIPHWMIGWTYPLFLLSLKYPHLFSSKQGRAIVAFNAETGALRWAWEMEPYQKLACEGDNEKFLERYHEYMSTNPTNEPLCLPDANAQPVIDGAGTAFVPFQDGNVYAVRDENGDGSITPNEVQVHHVGDGFQASPSMAPGLLAFLDCGGKLDVFRG